MRSLEEKLVGDEKRKRELSLAAGGRRSRDPRWTAEEGADDGESWGKTIARPWGLATWKESPNGEVKRWLACGKAAAATYLGMGKSCDKKGGSFGRRGLL
jgi:hypothetical protein